MRVANIIEEGRWGGPQKRITLVAAALKEYKVETTVLLPMLNSDRFQQTLNNAGVEWKSLPLHRLGSGWRTLFLYASTFVIDIYRLWRELRNGGYDLLHVSGGAWQFKGPIAGRLAGVPVVWHLNDTQMPRVLVILFNLLSPLADAFIVTANRVRNYYLNKKKFEDELIFSLQAPVDVHKYNREHVQLNGLLNTVRGIRVVAVANVSPVKGLDTLVAAISKLKKRINDSNLFIVGTTHDTQKKYYAALIKQAEALSVKPNIRFLGFQEDIPGLLATCDVFVCSSLAESGPMSVWEAMSMGCAIVSTDVGDVAEYIKDGESGFIVPVGNAQAMADAIYKLASNEALRHEFGRKARETACRALDVSIIAKKTAEGYSAVVAAHRKMG